PEHGAAAVGYPAAPISARIGRQGCKTIFKGHDAALVGVAIAAVVASAAVDPGAAAVRHLTARRIQIRASLGRAAAVKRITGRAPTGVGPGATSAIGGDTAATIVLHTAGGAEGAACLG